MLLAYNGCRGTPTPERAKYARPHGTPLSLGASANDTATALTETMLSAVADTRVFACKVPTRAGGVRREPGEERRYAVEGEEEQELDEVARAEPANGFVWRACKVADTPFKRLR